MANVTMREVGCPVVVHMYYRYTGLRAADVPWVASRDPQPVDARTPRIRQLRITGLNAADVRGLTLRDCELRPRAGERLITDRVDLREKG